jgi:TolB protein
LHRSTTVMINNTHPIRIIFSRTFCLFLLFAILSLFVTEHVSAQTEIEAKISKGAVKYIEAIDLAVIDFSPPDSSYASQITQVVKDDLNYSLYFRVAQIDTFVLTILKNDLYNMDGWYQLGVQYLLDGSIKMEQGKLKAEMHLADVVRKKVIRNFEVKVDGTDLRALAHAIADEVVLNFTGQKGIFSTQIAYVRWVGTNREIYACDYDGYNPRPLTNDLSLNLSPVWSPDGSKIIYTSYKNHNVDLWLDDVKTKQCRLFCSFPGLNSAAAWSPDGEYVAVTLTKDGNAEIYLLTPEGKMVRRLTFVRAIDSSPSWSPNGKEIAFTSDRSGYPQVFVMDIEGSNTRRLTYIDDMADSPCWSPRGDRIAFVIRSGIRFNVYTMDVTGENLTRLTFEGSNENPHWSPDGLHLVFSSNRTGKYEIYTMNWDGSNLRMITRDGENYNPAWSPRF